MIEQLAAKIGKPIIIEFDDVKMVEDDDRLGKIFPDSLYVNPGHIDGDRFNGGFRALQSTPEGNERIGSFSVAYKNDSTGIQVQNDGQIVMACANGDLIDGQLSEMLQFGMGESFFQIPFLYIFDDDTPDVEMIGHILDGHVPAKILHHSVRMTG
nr:hypothetical protein [Desulfosarcina alkanivorans]